MADDCQEWNIWTHDGRVADAGVDMTKRSAKRSARQLHIRCVDDDFDAPQAKEIGAVLEVV